MPRVYSKKPKAKPDGEIPPPAAPPKSAAVIEQTAATETAARPPADEQSGSAGLRPPSKPIEPTHDRDEPRSDERRGYQRDKIAASINIAKLQAMSMTDLNNMARELGVENFGTMRKHEVIFHVLQKNAERAGVLF
jgi:hypothetical protein